MEHERNGMRRAVGGTDDAAFPGGGAEGWRNQSLDVVVSSADVFVAHGLRWTVEQQRWSDFSDVSVTEATTLSEAVTATTTIRPKVIVLDMGRTPAQCFAYLPVLTEHSGVVLISRRHDANFAQLARRRGVAEVLVYDESADVHVVRAVRSAAVSAPPRGGRTSTAGPPALPARNAPGALPRPPKRAARPPHPPSPLPSPVGGTPAYRARWVGRRAGTAWCVRLCHGGRTT
ncbi:hypothetical protein ACFWZ2_08325 [Streptomyces sp. NPDC059002]|uniref:hypothetical protein n=1 Tax=Streptomyces sp. NPDC059002 TaxID=3346690 RepID=UPI0036B10B23